MTGDPARDAIVSVDHSLLDRWLDAAVSDPIIQAGMRRDGVSEAELRTVMHRAADQLAARKSDDLHAASIRPSEKQAASDVETVRIGSARESSSGLLSRQPLLDRLRNSALVWVLLGAAGGTLAFWPTDLW